MKIRFFSRLTLLIIFCLSFTKFYSSALIVINNEKLVEVGPVLSIYEDKSGKMSFNEAVKQNFISNHHSVPNLGISKSVFWVKMTVLNKSAHSKLLLDLSMPTLDYVEFYYLDIHNEYKSTSMGEYVAFHYRKYNDPDYLFDLNIFPGHSKVYYMKIHSKEGIQLPVKIGSEELVLDQIKNKGILSGLYVGIMLVMIFYNLFIFFSVKDRSYLFYVLYIFFTLLTQTSLQGYTFQYLWPNSPTMAQYSLFIFPVMTGITGMIFMNVFLKLKFYNSVLNKLTYILCIPYLISWIFLACQSFKFSQIILEVNSMIISVFMLITPIIIYRKGFKPAKFFFLAWSVFLVGIFIYILKDLEILPFNNFTRYIMQIGSAIETVLLSFALADRINILKREKEQSQIATLDALMVNKKLITEQNAVLERSVEQRTLELNNTLRNLKDTQSQLVTAEKMASLGQLTAGIAHEINNPINFVSANIKPLQLDIDDIMELLNKYEVITATEIPVDKLQEIETFKKKIDLGYLKKEMASLLSGIEDGAKRTADIVSGLRNFSRLDESDIKEANINEGIESTLILLKSVIPENTEVTKILGELPLIECRPGKLNQVFMNLITNSLHAIKRKTGSDKNNLTITTYFADEKIFVVFEDTGIGMTQDVQDKIFEPFFTTKAVGDGTGLGMSIVFKIIESHGAVIEVKSEYGVGTKIILILNKTIVV